MQTHGFPPCRSLDAFRPTCVSHVCLYAIQLTFFGLTKIPFTSPAPVVMVSSTNTIYQVRVTFNNTFNETLRDANSDLYTTTVNDLMGPVSFWVFFIVCFTSYFMLSVAVLQHSPGVVDYHLLLRRETRIPGVAPFSF